MDAIRQSELADQEYIKIKQEMMDLIDKFGLSDSYGKYYMENSFSWKTTEQELGDSLNWLSWYSGASFEAEALENFFMAISGGKAKAKKEAEKYEQEWKDAQEELTRWASIAEDLAKQMLGEDNSIEESGKDADEAAKSMGKMADRLREAKDNAEALRKELSSLPNIDGGFNYSRSHQHASGAWDIPYDNYPALLHRDEMVLTASRARQYREGGSEIDYTRLENALIAAVQRGMSEAQVNAYIDGTEVTDKVSRELANQMQGRRYG